MHAGSLSQVWGSDPAFHLSILNFSLHKIPSLFVKCPSCGKKMAHSDSYGLSIVCLPEYHDPK